MLTYIYLDVVDCCQHLLYHSKGLNSIFLSIMLKFNKMCLWSVVDGRVGFKMVRVHITLLSPYSINNDGHSPACMIA